MTNGHIVYIGNHKDLYLDTYQKETQSFIETQGIDLKIWDDTSISLLLKNNFDPKVLDAYKSMVPYALKADLARLCILYEFGGIYSDLGINFIKPIAKDGFDLVFFRDTPVEKVHGIDFAIQISVMFAKPKNDLLLQAISDISDLYLAKEYGDSPLHIGAGNVLGKLVLANTENNIYIGNFGSNFTTVQDCLSDNVILMYEQNGVVAHFKSFIKNESLKQIDQPKTNYVYAWINHKLYEGN